MQAEGVRGGNSLLPEFGVLLDKEILEATRSTRCLIFRAVMSLLMAFIVLIADASQNGMAGEYRSLADAAVLLGTLAACNVALDSAIYRWPVMQRLMEAPTVELIRDGKILRRNLQREWVTVDELMSKLREVGIADVADVKLAMLEADGQLSVLQTQGSVQPTDPAKHATAGRHIGENSRA